MSADHLVVNCEEQHARRLYHAGLTALARGQQKESQQAIMAAKQAVADAESISTSTRLEDLEPHRYVAVTDEERAAKKKEAAADALQHLQAERRALLAASDWTQLPDIPETTQKKWATYRKQLRDLNTKNPANVKWPKPPDD